MVTKLGPLMQFREQSTGPDQRTLILPTSSTRKNRSSSARSTRLSASPGIGNWSRHLIAELTEHNPILQKIKNGEAVSEEAEAFADLLHDEHPHITKPCCARSTSTARRTFIQFIRHILGIEVLKSFPDTVSAAFDQFIRAHTALTSQQLQFLSLLKNFIIERGRSRKTT